MKHTILIVEDYERILALLSAKMNCDGYDVIQAKNGVEALAIVDKIKPSLILTDIMMPLMDGYELCRKLKASENTSHIPIIILSGMSEVEDIILGFEVGAEDYLTKPYSLSILSVRVKSILRRIYNTSFEDHSPIVFISYSWDNQSHKDWTRNLAKKLQHNGVKVSLDQWDTHPGIDLPNYMETSIRESDFVLLICTPIFAEKANSSQGGVGYEKNIVTAELFQDSCSQKKFIPLLREGAINLSRPSYIKSRFFIDFRETQQFEESFEDLLRHIYGVPRYARPLLGSKPFFKSIDP